MPAPTERNRLDEEASPYLQAHAENPVNWQPWDEAALTAADERDVPIFLSIGYSACHWCHVMAEESFEDQAIAERLNQDFVPIKLDREERPDIDSIYMTVCQLVNQSGCGWPLSVWLTPEGHPFYVGTYFPKETSHGRPGFGDLLADISEEWESNREALVSRGRQWMQAARSELESTGKPSSEPLGSDLLETAGKTLVQRADPDHGGFGGGQKFPQPSRLELLAWAAHRGGVPDAEAVLVQTLDAMADGGLRDHLGGGFHRYCVDREWTVPHFEKMLYDNAGVARAFLTGYSLTGDDRYADVAAETFEFVGEELRHPEGAFYSTLDARSTPPGEGEDVPGRGVEGAFYVWTPEDVTAAVQTEEGTGAASETPDDPDPTLLEELVTARFGITQAGNFEGRTVLTIVEPIEALAESFDEDPATVEALLSIAEERLRAYRETRPRPPRDEKILAGWNGLMIDALAQGALVLGSEQYARWAADALEFIEARLWDGAQLHRRFMSPEAGDGAEAVGVKGDGVLEDYAFLARGALSVYEVTGSLDALAFALELSRTIRSQFWDPERGTLFYTPASGEELPVRPQELADQATPSSTGVALQVLLAMDAFAPGETFDTIVSRVLDTHTDRIQDSPMQHPSLVMAAEMYGQGHLEVAIAADQVPPPWMELLGSRYLPDRLLAPRPPSESEVESWVDQLGVESVPPIWAGREARSGPTAYVCRQACSPPVTDLDGLEEWIEEYR